MRFLEIGTGTGDVALALVRALPAGGMVLTMEADAHVAAAARGRFAEAGAGDRINVIVGEPARFLHKIRGPFDAVVLHPAHDQPATRQKLVTLIKAGGLLIHGNPKYSEKTMTTAEWLAHARADAEKRGLPELVPMLEGLAQATDRLRAADWNDDADRDPSRASGAASGGSAQSEPDEHN